MPKVITPTPSRVRNANVWVTTVGAAAVHALALAGQEEVYRSEGNR